MYVLLCPTTRVYMVCCELCALAACSAINRIVSAWPRQLLGADHLIPGGGVWFFFLIKLFFSFHQENKTFIFLLEQKQTIFFLRCPRQTFFFQDMFEDPFNCETGMDGSRVGLQ